MISKDIASASEFSSYDSNDGREIVQTKFLTLLKCTNFLDNEKYRVESN